MLYSKFVSLVLEQSQDHPDAIELIMQGMGHNKLWAIGIMKLPNWMYLD